MLVVPNDEDDDVLLVIELVVVVLLLVGLPDEVDDESALVVALLEPLVDEVLVDALCVPVVVGTEAGRLLDLLVLLTLLVRLAIDPVGFETSVLLVEEVEDEDPDSEPELASSSFAVG